MTSPIFSRCAAVLALGLMLAGATARAQSVPPGTKVLVLKKNPITRQPEYVDPQAGLVSRALNPVTRPLKRVKTAVVGPAFQQQGSIPGFGGSLDQRNIQAPTGAKATAARTKRLAAQTVNSTAPTRTASGLVKRVYNRVARTVTGR